MCLLVLFWINLLLYCVYIMFNIKICVSILYKSIQFGTVYVAFTNHMKKNQISFNFSFNIYFSWRFLIPGTQSCGRISWLQSEILFCPPKMNKKKHWKLGSMNPYCFISNLLQYSSFQNESKTSLRTFYPVIF